MTLQVMVKSLDPYYVQQRMEELSKDAQGQLLLSLFKRDINTFSNLLKDKSVNPNFVYHKPFFTTCIQYSCRKENCHLFVKELLKTKRVNPNANNPKPLHIAAKYGNEEALKIMLRHKQTNINIADSKGRNVLHYAVEGYCQRAKNKQLKKRYVHCIQLSMDKSELHINHPDFKGMTPLQLAVDKGDEQLLQTMILCSAHILDFDTHTHNRNSVRVSIERKFPNLIPLLPEGFTKSNKKNVQNRLLDSLNEKDLNKFVRILGMVTASGNSRVDPNYWYATCKSSCLEKAIKESRCEEFFKALLQAGADPNFINPVSKEAPIHTAVNLSRTRNLKTLVQITYTDVNTQSTHGKTALHMAVEKGDSESVEILLERKDIDLNRCDDNNNTALYIAAKKKHLSIVQSILECMKTREIYIMRQDKEIVSKNFPKLSISLEVCEVQRNLSNPLSELFQCMYRDNTENFCKIFESELSFKRNHANSDDGRLTLLQHAVIKNKLDVVEYLLKHGADPNGIVYPQLESPPVIMATAFKCNEILKMFFELPKEYFNINVRDVKGNTALHFAASNHDVWQVVELLRHGADVNVRNVYNKTPFDNKNLENILNLCIKKNGYPSEENYQVIFDMSLLLSLKRSPLDSQENEKINKSNYYEQDSEMEGAIDDCSYVYSNENTSHAVEFSQLRKNTSSYHPLHKFSVSSSKTNSISSEYQAYQSSFSHIKQDHGSTLENISDVTSTELISGFANEKVQAGEIANNITVLDEEKADTESVSYFNTGILPFTLDAEFYDVLEDDPSPDESNISVGLSHRDTHIDINNEHDTSTQVEDVRLQLNEAYSESRVKLNNATRTNLQYHHKDINSVFATELGFLYEITKSQKNGSIISHPVISCFVSFKWHMMRYFIYANMAITLIFVLCLNIYLLQQKKEINDIFWFITLVSLGMLLIREVGQLVTSNTWHKSIGNIVEQLIDWSLIIMTLIFLFNMYFPGLLPIVIFFSWVEMLIVLSRINFFALGFEMFKTVSKSYLRYLLSYASVILAFALTFHSINLEKHSQINHNSTEVIQPFFVSLPLSFVKTTMMMTGEYDVGDPEYFHDAVFAVIFVLFVFFTTIVLLNLLTGLAVSDTKKIMDRSKQVRIISQIAQLYEIESIIFKLFHLVNAISSKLGLLFVSNLIRYRYQKLTIFPDIGMKDHVLLVYPNKKCEITVNEKTYRNWKIDSEILGDAIDIISKQINVSESDEIYERLDMLQNSVDQIEKLSRKPNETKELNTLLIEINEMKQMMNDLKGFRTLHAEINNLKQIMKDLLQGIDQ